MIRAVLDANTLASGFAGFRQPNSIPGQLLRLWRQECYDMVVSEHMRLEVIHTLQQPYFRRHVSPAQASRVAALLRYEATQTTITIQVHGVATHQEDDLVLATALSAKAEDLVSGDTKLQKLGAYKGVTIVSPRVFLDMLTTQPI